MALLKYVKKIKKQSIANETMRHKTHIQESRKFLLIRLSIVWLCHDIPKKIFENRFTKFPFYKVKESNNNHQNADATLQPVSKLSSKEAKQTYTGQDKKPWYRITCQKSIMQGMIYQLP